MKIKNICKNAILAAIYVVLCAVNPISFGVLQFRLANILVALPLLKRQYTPGVLVGIAIANMSSPLGVWDVAFGVGSEGIAYLLTVYGPLKNKRFWIKAAVVSACVGAIIGGELVWTYHAPYVATAVGLFDTTFAATMVGYWAITKTALKRIL